MVLKQVHEFRLIDVDDCKSGEIHSSIRFKYRKLGSSSLISNLLDVLHWPKSSLRFFVTLYGKSPIELFGQLNISLSASFAFALMERVTQFWNLSTLEEIQPCLHLQAPWASRPVIPNILEEPRPHSLTHWLKRKSDHQLPELAPCFFCFVFLYWSIAD